MDEKQAFWNVFTQTGRVEDYLRYCRCGDTPPEQEEAPHEEVGHRRTDYSGNPRGGSR